MRQTQTRKNNVSEKVFNDKWTEAEGVNLSEECIATARFRTLRARLLEGYEWVNGRPTKIQNTTRPDSSRTEAWTPVYFENVTERVHWNTCIYLATLSHASG